MKRDLKKAFSFILVLALVIGLMPAPASFAAVPANLDVVNPGANVQTPMPADLQRGEIWTDKSVTYSGIGEFTVTLKAAGKDYPRTTTQAAASLDIILVLDCSDSMDEKPAGSTDSKLTSMKAAAKSAVDTLLNVPGQSNRVAVVKFNNTAVKTVSFSTNSSVSGPLKTGINGLETTSTTGKSSDTAYTNIQDAFRLAREIVNSRVEGDKLSGQFRKPVVILMSDGAPTRYTESVGGNSGTPGDRDYPTTNLSVKWTVQEGMTTHLNGDKVDIDIYTIGFGVGNDSKAVATLQPTAVYSGQQRTASESGTVQYYSSNSGSSWQLSTPDLAGAAYQAPSVSQTFGSWNSLSDYYYEPTDTWGDWSRNSWQGSATSLGGSKRVRLANATRTGTDYNVTPSSSFDYKYWSPKSTIVSDDAGAIFNAFIEIATSLTGYRPMAYTLDGSGQPDYKPVTVTDVLGDEFELVPGTYSVNGGPMSATTPAGVTVAGKTLTWAIQGSQFNSIPYSVTGTSIASQYVHSLSFKVKIRSNAEPGGPYYTNQSAKGSFEVLKENPFYNKNGTEEQPLGNRGWLSLVPRLVPATIKIIKTVEGPVTDTDRIFNFSLYYDAALNNFITSTSITVHGAGSADKTIAREIDSRLFDQNGNLTIYVKETDSNADPDWTYDNVNSHPVKITRTNPSGEATFLNKYNPKGALTVTKAWAAGAPETDSVTFDLKKEVSDGAWDVVTSGLSLNPNNNWTQTISNLALDARYKVEETPIPQDYRASYDTEGVMLTAQVTRASITITNDYDVPTGEITINKIWHHEDNPEGDRPTSLTFTVTGPNNVTYPSITLSGTSDDPAWSNVFQTTTFGAYTFTELVPLDYEADHNPQSQTINVTPGQRTASLTFINTYHEPKGSMTVTKNWVGDSNNMSYRPSTITLKLWKEGSTDPVGTVTLPQNGNVWSHIFTDLDFGTYSVSEEGVSADDYDVSYSDDNSVTLTKYAPDGSLGLRNSGITVTNTFKNPTGQINVTKTWVESSAENALKVRPSQITISLLKDGEPTEYSITLPKSGDTPWSHTFTGLPLDGTYTVEESAAGDDADKLAKYDDSYEYFVKGVSVAGITLDQNNRIGSAHITNTNGNGTIVVEKVWNDGNNQDLPTSVNVRLYKIVKIEAEIPTTLNENEAENPAAIDGTGTEITVAPDENEAEVPATLDGVGTETPEIIQAPPVVTLVGEQLITRPADPDSLGSTVFYDLEMGDNISYYVVEDSVLFYTTEYSTNSDGGLILNSENPNGKITVTNTYTDPRGVLTVNKIWNSGNNPHQPTSVQVTLYADGVALETVDLVGTRIFDGLTLGAVYTVAETVPGHYTVAYSAGSSTVTEGENGMLQYTPMKANGDVASGVINITNTYEPEVGSLEVIKQWEGKTGSELTITLSRSYGGQGENSEQRITDTTFKKVITLNSENGWKETVDNLELYGPGGAPYYYNATEEGEGLNLYTTVNPNTPTLSTEGKAVILITNTYAPDQGTLTIQKEWRDGNGQEIPAPVDKISVTLVVNGNAQEGSIELNKDNGWKATLEHLDVDSTYSVQESTYDEAFKATYSADNIQFTAAELSKYITVTNSRIEDKPGIGVTKSALDTTAVLNEDGTATFIYTVEMKNTGNRTLSNLYIIDEVSAGAIGATITYSPEPDTISYNGKARFNLQGSLAPGDSRTFNYTITVDKSGVYNNLATVYGTYGEGTEIYGKDDENVTVKEPGLSIVKNVIGATSKSGNSGTFLYELRVRNDGEFPLTNVTVKDEMTPADPAAVMVYSYSGSGDGAPTFDSESKTFTIGDLSPEDGDVVINYTVTITGDYGSYKNVATATGFYENEYGSGTRKDSDDAEVILTEPTGGGGGGGGGGGSTPNNPPVIIQNEPVPAGPVPAPEVTIEDQAIPAGPLPKTGGLDALLLYGLGALLAGGGFALRRKEKNK